MDKSMMDAILGPANKGSDSEASEGDELELVAQELIEAVHARNSKDVADALRAAFECLGEKSESSGS